MNEKSILLWFFRKKDDKNKIYINIHTEVTKMQPPFIDSHVLHIFNQQTLGFGTLLGFLFLVEFDRLLLGLFVDGDELLVFGKSFQQLH